MVGPLVIFGYRPRLVLDIVTDKWYRGLILFSFTDTVAGCQDAGAGRDNFLVLSVPRSPFSQLALLTTSDGYMYVVLGQRVDCISLPVNTINYNHVQGIAYSA